MKLHKRLASALVATMVLTSMPVATMANDYDSHWASEAITKWTNKKVVEGFEDGSFRPSETITKAQFAKILVELMGYNTTEGSSTYTDVDEDKWYSDYVTKISAAGVMHETSSTFSPNNGITREEAAYALVNAYKLENNGVDKAAFTDEASISDWALDNVKTLYNAGYIKGNPDGSFNPKGTLTRAELITMIDRMNSDVVNTKGEYSNNVTGNLVVNTTGVTLKDMTIDGDLYLAEGIGQGEVEMENVTVNGRVIVEGGGINSIKADRKCKFNSAFSVYAKHPVRIIIEGDKIDVYVAAGAEVHLKGKYDEIKVGAGAKVILDNATVDTITTEETGKAPYIEIKSNSTVEKLVADVRVTIQGNGKLVELVANAKNISSSIKPDRTSGTETSSVSTSASSSNDWNYVDPSPSYSNNSSTTDEKEEYTVEIENYTEFNGKYYIVVGNDKQEVVNGGTIRLTKEEAKNIKVDLEDLPGNDYVTHWEVKNGKIIIVVRNASDFFAINGTVVSGETEGTATPVSEATITLTEDGNQNNVIRTTATNGTFTITNQLEKGKKYTLVATATINGEQKSSEPILVTEDVEQPITVFIQTEKEANPVKKTASVNIIGELPSDANFTVTLSNADKSVVEKEKVAELNDAHDTLTTVDEFDTNLEITDVTMHYNNNSQAKFVGEKTDGVFVFDMTAPQYTLTETVKFVDANNAAVTTTQGTLKITYTENGTEDTVTKSFADLDVSENGETIVTIEGTTALPTITKIEFLDAEEKVVVTVTEKTGDVYLIKFGPNNLGQETYTVVATEGATNVTPEILDAVANKLAERDTITANGTTITSESVLTPADLAGITEVTVNNETVQVTLAFDPADDHKIIVTVIPKGDKTLTIDEVKYGTTTFNKAQLAGIKINGKDVPETSIKEDNSIVLEDFEVGDTITAELALTVDDNTATFKATDVAVTSTDDNSATASIDFTEVTANLVAEATYKLPEEIKDVESAGSATTELELSSEGVVVGEPIKLDSTTVAPEYAVLNVTGLPLPKGIDDPTVKREIMFKTNQNTALAYQFDINSCTIKVVESGKKTLEFSVDNSTIERANLFGTVTVTDAAGANIAKDTTIKFNDIEVAVSAGAETPSAFITKTAIDFSTLPMDVTATATMTAGETTGTTIESKDITFGTELRDSVGNVEETIAFITSEKIDVVVPVENQANLESTVLEGLKGKLEGEDTLKEDTIAYGDMTLVEPEKARVYTAGGFARATDATNVTTGGAVTTPEAITVTTEGTTNGNVPIPKLPQFQPQIIQYVTLYSMEVTAQTTGGKTIGFTMYVTITPFCKSFTFSTTLI